MDTRQHTASPPAMRLDKWLWAARFFKSRTLATRACELGRVEVAGQRAKAARAVSPGDQIRVRNEGGEFEIEVLALAEMRGPAAAARALYRESEASQQRRQAAAALRREAGGEPAGGRPGKRDRRRILRFRDAGLR